MRIAEIVRMIKPKPPLNPTQARMASLKNNVDLAKKNVKAERDRQRSFKDSQEKLAAIRKKY